MRIGVLQWPASCVRVNLGHWDREGQKSEISKVFMLTLRRKSIIIVRQIHICGPCEDKEGVYE